jgi:hypothetical protein
MEILVKFKTGDIVLLKKLVSDKFFGVCPFCKKVLRAKKQIQDTLHLGFLCYCINCNYSDLAIATKNYFRTAKKD